MPLRLEDYALIGDSQTAALVGRDGSIDWLCVPRFDSGACFAALLGTPEHGRWLLAPRGRGDAASRRALPARARSSSRPSYETAEGVGPARSTACPPRRRTPDVVRIVEGVRGRVADADGARHPLRLRVDRPVGAPAVRRRAHPAIARPRRPAACARPVAHHGARPHHRRRVHGRPPASASRSTLTWHPSHEPAPEPDATPAAAIATTERLVARRGPRAARYTGAWRDAVLRSLDHAEGADLSRRPAASWPRRPRRCPSSSAASRNWDYRYCWLRDATFTLYALMLAGYIDEAQAWREWLLARGRRRARASCRSCTGSPASAASRSSSSPGSRATRARGRCASATPRHEQFQLDVYGEVMDALHLARRAGLAAGRRTPGSSSGPLIELPRVGLARAGRGHLGGARPAPALHALEGDGLGGARPRREGGRALRLRRARSTAGARVRAAIHDEVCARASTPSAAPSCSPTAARTLDASLLMIPLVGFLPAERRARPGHRRGDRARARWSTASSAATRPTAPSTSTACRRARAPSCPCTFWLADNLLLLGRRDEARRIFERLLALRNDVGLLSEEYDPRDAPPARQLPPGLLPRRADQHGAEPLAGRRPRAPPARRDLDAARGLKRPRPAPALYPLGGP